MTEFSWMIYDCFNDIIDKVNFCISYHYLNVRMEQFYKTILNTIKYILNV